MSPHLSDTLRPDRAAHACLPPPHRGEGWLGSAGFHHKGSKDGRLGLPPVTSLRQALGWHQVTTSGPALGRTLLKSQALSLGTLGTRREGACVVLRAPRWSLLQASAGPGRSSPGLTLTIATAEKRTQVHSPPLHHLALEENSVAFQTETRASHRENEVSGGEVSGAPVGGGSVSGQRVGLGVPPSLRSHRPALCTLTFQPRAH